MIISDRKAAGVFEVAKKHNVETAYVNKEGWVHPQELLEILQKRKIDFIVLAGFLKLIPKELINLYDRKLMNIHPALLPKYGGKGMFGMHVHEAVYKAKEKETGISIHFVNKNYDDGDLIFQAKTRINDNDSPEQIAQKVHLLEMKYFPKIIEEVLLK